MWGTNDILKVATFHQIERSSAGKQLKTSRVADGFK